MVIFTRSRVQRELASELTDEGRIGRKEGRLLFVSGLNWANIFRKCQKGASEERPLCNANRKFGCKRQKNLRGECRDNHTYSINTLSMFQTFMMAIRV